MNWIMKSLIFFKWLYVISICAMESMAGIPESAFGMSQSEDKSILLSLGGSVCGMCNALDVLGPPPDTILTIPPPPIPSFLLETLNVNKSNSGNCNFCHIFATDMSSDENSSFSQPSIHLANPWICILIVVSITSIAAGAIIAVFFMKCKKWKIFPVADSCPILPENFLGNKNSSNETTPKGTSSPNFQKQKVKESKETKLKTSLKYWQQEYSQEYPLDGDGSQYIIGNELFIDSEDHKTPGTPIYTELDVTPGNEYRIGIVNNDCTPYAVHTYVGIDNNLQNAPTHEIINGAYDNAAFLPSEGKKSPPISLPKAALQSSTTPRWSSSVPASPVPSYPHRLTTIRKTYSLGRKAVKIDTSNPALAKVKILQTEGTSPQIQKENLPTNCSKYRGSVVDGYHKRPLPPIPLEQVHNTMSKKC